MYPRQSPTTHTEQLGDEASVYDWARLRVHALNPIAARVWRLCDGATSPEAIAAALARDLVPEAEAVVELTLRELARLHLLDEPVASRVDRPDTTRRWLLQRGVTAALLPAIASIAAPSPVEALSPSVPGTGSATFTVTGVPEFFTVPEGIVSLTIQATGAQGGRGIGTLTCYLTGVGGRGGRTTATVAVTPGATLTVLVGGPGNLGQFGGAGGFNGGGNGSSALGGGGGGASSVLAGATPLVIAGGGGGGGAGCIETTAGGHGGYGGGLIGDPGGAAPGGGGGGGGGGGTQVAGGAGGAASPGGNPGTPGAAHMGGTGGLSGGGGGGGGYFGGGGGSSGNASNPGASGGGGGSSFTVPGATAVVHEKAVIGGTLGVSGGVVTISW